MNNLNQIIIEGKVSEKPNYKTENLKHCLFVISVEHNYKNSIGEITKEIDNFEIIAYASLADLSKNLVIGDTVRLVGRLRQKRWTDSNGKKYCGVYIVAEHIEKLGERNV